MPIFKEVNAIETIKLTEEIHKASKRLSKGPAELFTLARKGAEAERVYRKALSMEIMKLRLEGLPATLIGDIARGNCADQKWSRDLADAELTAGRDGLKAIICEVTALQSILRHQTEV